MAFVSIDNPSGIFHHGGQMAWDAVSDTRVVMVTITTDFKVLVQEINQVSGAPIVGTPSFVAAITAPGILATHYMQPKVKSIAGTDLIFVMVPTAFAAGSPILSTAYTLAGTQKAFAYITAGWDTRIKVPTSYTGYILERDSSGRYTVKSSTSITPFNGSLGQQQTTPLYKLFIESATSTAIRLRKACHWTAYNNSSSSIMDATLTGSTISNFTTSLGANTMPVVARSNVVCDAKRVRDKNGKYSNLTFMAGVPHNLSTDMTRVCHGLWNDASQYVPISSSVAYAPYGKANSHGTLASTVLIDKDADKFFAVGNNVVGQNTLINAAEFSYSGAGAPLFTPLDTGFVSSVGVICVVGGTSTPGDVLLDADLGYSIETGDQGSTIPLKLSFRLLLGAGQYVSPTDQYLTPYFYKSMMNNNQVLHKVDDTHFWLIGCFMADENATPKLGVISVNV